MRSEHTACAELSAVLVGARWYDALTGRWLSADTIVPGAGNPQSLNRYTYVNNNPLAYIDPSGHIAWVPIGAAVGALIGAGVVYGTQVAANLNRGMDFGQALTTDLDAAKIVRGAVTGAVIGTGVGAVASLVAAGAATASVATAGTAATTAVTAAVSDDGGAGEAQALATMAQRVAQVGTQSPQGQTTIAWLENETNRVGHIMAPKHLWDRLVLPSGDLLRDYRAVQPIIRQAVEGGRGEFVRSTKLGPVMRFVSDINGQEVVVNAVQLGEKVYQVVDAWVRR